MHWPEGGRRETGGIVDEAVVNTDVEARVLEIGSELYRLAAAAPPSLFDGRGLKGRVMSAALRDEQLRSALFQFVDTLPQLDSASALREHFFAYLERHVAGGAWGRLLKFGSPALLAPAVRIGVGRVARYFLVEDSRRAIGRVLGQLASLPAQASFDAVGEAVLSEAEAEHYLQRNLDLIDWQVRTGAQRPHLSIKLSALSPRADPIDPAGSRARIMQRLGHLMPRVQATRACLTIDMEQAEFKPLILEVFEHLLQRHGDPGWLPAIALQAYLRDTPRDLERIIALARERKRRIGVRLVKGAYWDTEVAAARQRRWPAPVFEEKVRTDAQFEQLTDRLFEQADVVYPAIATHNIRSVAHAVARARLANLPTSAWEVQMLYGMADPLVRALGSFGVATRVYVPVGDLITGIAYLIRRLMENTANTSIVRQTYADARAARELLARPAPQTGNTARAEARGFANTALLDFSQHAVRERFQAGLATVLANCAREYPLAVRGTKHTGAFEPAVNPADPAQELGRFELATPAHVDQAVSNAHDAFGQWRDTPAPERIALCLRAADIMLERREQLAACQVLEVGKNWREADADVAEAIDYLRYYAQEMARLEGWQPTTLYPGELNHLRYEPRGVAVIIAPWNFPLAILAGMTSAALVSGNTAIMKPAGPAQLVAQQLAEVLHEAGFPPQVCQLLPGRGEQVGRRLVEHPDVALIAFTGSREVGLSILRQSAGLSPGQRQL